MALTKIGTDGVKDDAVTSDKVANAINSAIAANTAKTSLEDESVTLAKLEHGTSSNNGKFLRANNGADPTFETVSTDLVADTSPQLGGNLDGNGNTIDLSGNTDSMILPKGTTAQRDGSPVAGELRFNTSINAAELYNGTDWAKVGSTVVEVDYIVLAGGGAGGSYYRGGGGGAGGYRSSNSVYGNSGGGNSAEDTLELQKNVSYALIVGAGGVGTNATSTANPGASGSNSKFHTIESIGGGGGGVYQGNGTSGGSGGGGGGNGGSTAQAGTTNQGYAGGVGAGSEPPCGGGGGGAGGTGYGGGSGPQAGDGGVGVASTITGSSVYRGGGGGAGAYGNGNNFPVGGNGGGASGKYGYQDGADAPNNLGGGGGGSPGAVAYGGDGGSGVVILRLASAITATFSNGVTQSSATVGSDKVYTITATTGTSQTVTFS